MFPRARLTPWRWTVPLVIGAAIAVVGLARESGLEPEGGSAPSPARAEAASGTASGPREVGALLEASDTAVGRVAVPEPLVLVHAGSGRAPRPGTERAHYQELVAESREDFDAFAERVDQALSGEHPTALRVAALRAWFDQARDRGLRPFVDVLADAETQLELREFALRFLGNEARRHVEARRVLRAYLESRPPEARWRAEALFAVLRWGEDDEVRDCLGPLRIERDPGVLARAAEALGSSDACSATSIRELVCAWIDDGR